MGIISIFFQVLFIVSSIVVVILFPSKGFNPGFISACSSAVVITVTFGMNIFKKTKIVIFIRKFILKVANLFKTHDLSVIIEIKNEDSSLTIEDFKLSVEPNKYAFNVVKQMEHTDKILIMNLSRENDFNYQYKIFIDETIMIEFNELIAYRWNIQKYLKSIEKIVNIHTKDIKNSQIKYSARILFSDNKNPYLPFYMQTQTTNKDLEISAEIKIGMSYIYNHRIEMKTDSFKSLDDEIEDRVIKLKY